jgi:hypothetical protein
LEFPACGQAISGDLPWGSSPVRFVFIDEAGTAEHEPVTIVVGLIVNADEQLMLAEAAIKEVLPAVPEQFREGFIFHATEVWSDPKYRPDWSMADRLALLRAMMALPRRLGIPIAFGMVRRDVPIPDEHRFGMTQAQYRHLEAFHGCIARADKYIRERADLKEVASVVAEDVPEMRKFLKLVPQLLRDDPFVLPPGLLRPTEEEKRLGYVTQESEFRVSRIRRSIHFVDKDSDPVLQLADACAFGFRRYFSEQQFGEEFVEAILGQELVKEDFAGPSSYTTFCRPPQQKDGTLK